MEEYLVEYLLEEEADEDCEMLFLAHHQQNQRSEEALYKERQTEGFFTLLMKGHFENDEESFRQFIRLNREQFNFLVTLLGEDLKCKSTPTHKNPITPEEKLAVTLRFMATGESYRSLAFAFRISHNYISVIVKETLRALSKHLVPLFLPKPTHEVLKMNADDFSAKWNFPHCVAAIDGKHIRIKCPKNSGSLFFNYKEYFSLVLLAMVDANCKFVVVDVGSYGKEGDGGIFSKSNIGKYIYSGKMFPQDEELPGFKKRMPFVIVGDEAFCLHKHIMKPYSRSAARGNRANEVFNYRLCRARRVTENAFGILSQVFRIFLTPIAIEPHTCDNLVLAACCLHNLLRSGYLSTNKQSYECDSKDQASTGFAPLKAPGGFAKSDGFDVRNAFAQYFCNEGALDWQDRRIYRLSS